MTERQYGVCGIGHAIVDILAETPDELVASQAQFGMVKGSMTLIDAPRAKAIYDVMPPSIECSGGSAGNSMACFGSFGGKAAFIGVTADDQFGTVYRHDMKASGIAFSTPPVKAQDNLASAQCLILVTPDAQRTMNTYLGASTGLGPEHIDRDVIAASAIVYMEGYLFDLPHNKAGFEAAAKVAHEVGTKVAITLSDSFCVERHRADFLALIRGGVDLVFANEHELVSLYQTATLDDAIAAIRKDCPLAAVTCGANGSLIVTPTEVIKVPAVKPSELVDTTGAGDAYAGGFLFGLTRGDSLADCGYLGSLAASEVISHIGPRPQTKLSDLLAQAPRRVA